MKGINWSEWVKVLYGLLLSTVLGFALGFLVVKTVGFIFRNADRRKTIGAFRGAQIFGGAAMAFMTADVFEEDIRKCREAGMNDHIAKPVEPEILYRTLIRNLIS